MEQYAWLIGFLVAMFNPSYCQLLLTTESRLQRERKIPARGKVWYLMELNFFRAGDLVFVTILDFCAVVVLLTGRPSWAVGTVCLILVLLFTAYLHFVKWLPRKAGYDSAYPAKGKVSLVGILHLPYFAFQWTLGLMAGWEVIQMLVGVRPPSLSGAFLGVLGIVAFICYVLTMRSDQKAGRFSGPPPQ